jgi:hypothetical protein
MYPELVVKTLTWSNGKSIAYKNLNEDYSSYPLLVFSLLYMSANPLKNKSKLAFYT